MNNIKLKIKMSAYAKGIIPDVSKFVEDAPKDDNTYARKNETWVPIKEQIKDQQIIVEEGSGLTLTNIHDNIDKLEVRQKVVNELPEVLEEDTTYYVTDENNDNVIPTKEVLVNMLYPIGITIISSKDPNLVLGGQWNQSENINSFKTWTRIA